MCGLVFALALLPQTTLSTDGDDEEETENDWDA
jgi:hypothetical protein